MIAQAHPVATLVVQGFICAALIVVGVLLWLDADERRDRDDSRRLGRVNTNPPRCLRSSDPSPVPRERAS